MYAEIVLRSETGASLVKDVPRVTPTTFHVFEAGPDSPAEMRDKLESVGFTVIAATKFGLSIAGPEKLYQEYFKAKINRRPLQMFFGGGQRHETKGFFIDEPPKIPKEIHDRVESLYVPPMGYFLAGEGPMPTPSYYHLRPPDDITRLTNADHAHSRGYRGAGVRVAMVDSGFIENHDYYSGRGYNLTVHAAIGSTTQDEYGHGTGIASNVLAIAPECDFHFFKMSDGSQWATLAAFRMAVAQGARIITNSWGLYGRDTVLEAEIAAAVAGGITVIFACGNDGPVGCPGCMPDVISVGGAFPNQDGTWQASSYASSGFNTHYPERRCPDLSAIVGQGPKGIFIVQPTMEGASFDHLFGGGVFPNGDETGGDDGWLVASGTSAAAPMVAGAAALLLQARPSLTPAEIRQTLEDTCIDVTTGTSASGENAGIGRDDATGAGTINIGAAVDDVVPPTGCPRAPIIPCPRAPLPCFRAPRPCARAPLPCVRAPLPCPRAPYIDCIRGPICYRAPIPRGCPPAPIPQCLAGPWKRPIDDPLDPIADPRRVRPRDRVRPRRLVPVIIMVDEEEVAMAEAGGTNDPELGPEEARALAMQAAHEAYYAAMEEMGMCDEFENFPDVEGCQRGPFDPSAGT